MPYHIRNHLLTTTASTTTSYYYYRSKATSDVQSIKTEYSQELSQAQMQAMEAMEAMRVRTDAQIDSLRSQLDSSQKILQEKISHYEQVVSGS